VKPRLARLMLQCLLRVKPDNALLEQKISAYASASRTGYGARSLGGGPRLRFLDVVFRRFHELLRRCAVLAAIGELEQPGALPAKKRTLFALGMIHDRIPELSMLSREADTPSARNPTLCRLF
jgi:hypothetical protein